MRATQRGPAPKDQAKWRCVGNRDGGKSFDDMPIFLDERGTWEAEMRLCFQQFLERWPIAQELAPRSRTAADVRSALLREPPD